MATITIHKKDKILKGEITLPASKSISNRALVIQYLSGGKLNIKNLSEAEDTKLMHRLLGKIETKQNSSETTNLDCQNAGTVFRFLTAYLALKPGRWLLTGSERMKIRPIGPLVNALKKLGASVGYLENENFPPLLIEGKPFPGGNIETDSSISSQFITALLLIAPALPGGLNLKLVNNISSVPYIEMTLKLLNICGIKSNFSNNTITISQQEFVKSELTIEPDWTSASYWYEMAAFADEVDLVLKGLKKDSLQGDSILPEIYCHFGVCTEFMPDGIKLAKKGKVDPAFAFDFTDYPDLALSVIVTCAGLNVPGEFTGLESLRIKESDRLSVLQSELNKIGIKTQLSRRLKLKIQNSKFKSTNAITVKTYNDHRMAMAFAPLALLFDSIQILNPEVVSKSYPGFWEDLKNTGFLTNEISISYSDFTNLQF